MTQRPLTSGGVSSPEGVSRSTRWRVGRMLAMAPFVATTLSGCYRYTRVDSARAPVGAQVSAELTDQGRLALLDSLGQSPGSVEGRLLSADDSSITLAVSGVRALRGGERTPWTGERVTLRRSSFDGLRERRLAAGPSALAGVLVAGAIVALAVTLGITGSTDGDPGDKQPTRPPGEQ